MQHLDGKGDVYTQPSRAKKKPREENEKEPPSPPIPTSHPTLPRNEFVWNVVTAVLTWKALHPEDSPPSEFESLSRSLVNFVTRKCEISTWTLTSLWRKYLQRHVKNNPTDALLSAEEEKQPKPHHFKDRITEAGSRLSADQQLSLIKEVNSTTGGKTSVRELAAELQRLHRLSIPVSSLQDILHPSFHHHRSYVKPLLSDKNVVQRVLKALDQVDLSVVHRINEREFFKLKDLRKLLFLDEKWFYIAQEKERVRVANGDSNPPSHAVHHKSHIPKLMFEELVGYPQVGPRGELFNGKPGILVFADEIDAQRSSRNRPRGTPELHEYQVNSATFLDLMVREGGVLDLFDRALPWRQPMEFTIEMDNAKPHVGNHNFDTLREAAAAKGFGLSMQTAQSPDQNPLDLALNHAFMTRASNFKVSSHNLDELSVNVYTAYTNYPPDNIRRAYALLYEIYKKILSECGKVDYAIPHTHITKRQGGGEEEIDEYVGVEIVERAAQFIIDH